MNLGDRDLFELWRLLLATTCGIYATVVTVRSLVGWLLYFSEPKFHGRRSDGRHRHQSAETNARPRGEMPSAWHLPLLDETRRSVRAPEHALECLRRRPSGRGVSLAESLEDLRPFLLRDADARVGHREM